MAPTSVLLRANHQRDGRTGSQLSLLVGVDYLSLRSVIRGSGVRHIKRAEGIVAQACPSFRVILPARTRSLKLTGLRLVADEPVKGALR
jgi:hypothetical protein